VCGGRGNRRKAAKETHKNPQRFVVVTGRRLMTKDAGRRTTHDPPLCGEPDGTVGPSPKPKARGMNHIIADRIAQAQRVPGIIISLINYMYTLPGYQYIYKSSILFLTVVVREP